MYIYLIYLKKNFSINFFGSAHDYIVRLKHLLFQMKQRIDTMKQNGMNDTKYVFS